MGLLFSLPAALDALVAVGRMAVDSDVQIEDGQPVRDIEQDVLAIALTDDEDEVVTPRDQASLGGRDDLESYDIQCMIKVVRGDVETKPARDRAFHILRDFHRTLMSDDKLGGAVTKACITNVVYSPSRLPNMGLTVTLTFRVHIEAFTS